MSTNASASAPGSSGARRASSASSTRCTFSSCSTFPQVNDAQERPQRGRRPDPAEQRRHRAVPQQVHVVDAVRPGDHPGHQAGHLQLRRSPRTGGRSAHAPRPGRPGPPAGPGPSPAPGPPATRDSGHQTSRGSSPAHATIALDEVLLSSQDDGSFSNSHRPRSEGTFRVDAPHSATIYAVDRGLTGAQRLDELLLIHG